MADKIISINTLAGEFDKAALQEYTNNLFLTNKKIVEENERLKGEIAHLKMLIGASVPILASEDNPVEIISKDSQIICDINIARIRERTMDREISFEDAKKLEILVKTKAIVEGDKKTIKGNKSKTKDISDDLLVSLAAQPVESPNDST